MTSKAVEQQGDLLFVYGSLRHGEHGPIARRLATEGEHRGEAVMAGRLYWFDGFCGAVDSNSKDDLIRGDVFELPKGGKLLAALDEYEGINEQSDFHRVQRPVIVGDPAGSSVLKAWVYMFRGALAGRRQIEGGDLRAALRNKTIKA